jgi:hypothetical protein
MVPLVPLKGQWKHPTRSSCKLWSNTLPTHIVPQEIALELQNRDECDRIAGMYTDISLSHETGHVCFLSAWMVSSIISLTRFSAQVKRALIAANLSKAVYIKPYIAYIRLIIKAPKTLPCQPPAFKLSKKTFFTHFSSTKAPLTRHLYDLQDLDVPRLAWTGVDIILTSCF